MVFLLVEAADMWWTIFQQYREGFEILSNAVMLLIAIISLFMIGLRPRINGNGALSSILGCIMIPVITFPMNIDVFEHTIQLEHILSDLWGWHLFWIAYAVVEVLVLSRLVQNLLSQIVALLKWVRRIISLLGKTLEDAVINSSKSIRLTVSAGLLLWGAYLGIQIHARDMASVFSDVETFRMSVWLWTAVIVVCLLIHIASQAFPKAGEAVQKMNGKIVLVVIIGVIFFLLNSVLPVLLQAIAMIILISLVPTGLLGLIIKGAGKAIRRPSDYGGSTQRTTDAGGVEPKDLMVVLICFVGVPLFVLSGVTALSDEGKNIIDQQDLSDVSTYLNFISAALEVAKAMLDMVI